MEVNVVTMLKNGVQSFIKKQRMDSAGIQPSQSCFSRTESAAAE